MTRRFLPLCAALSLAAGAVSSSASAANPGANHRAVAVLEYRAAVTSLPSLGQRLAERLRKLAALDVVDAAEARRRSASIVGDIGHCAGDAACTARIGATIEVDEVLLLAMSQLGDLVIQIQRVDVDSRQSRTQLSDVVSEGAELTDDQLDTWLHQLYPPETFVRYGYISVKADVDGAEVKINGQSRGLTPVETRVKVRAQRTRVEVDKPGRVPFSVRIDVPPDGTVEVTAHLPEAGREVSWYKRWYVWAIVGGLATGAAAGTAVYLTRPDDAHARASVLLCDPTCPGN